MDGNGLFTGVIVGIIVSTLIAMKFDHKDKRGHILVSLFGILGFAAGLKLLRNGQLEAGGICINVAVCLFSTKFMWDMEILKRFFK